MAAIACAITLSGRALPTSGSTAAAGQGGVEGEPSVQTDASVPARGVYLMGSSPLEGGNETWGIGQVGPPTSPEWAIVRFTSESGWSVAPGPLDAKGQPLHEFKPDENKLAGQLTPSGAGVLVGSAPQGEAGSARQEVVLVRDPGGAFQATDPVPQELRKPEPAQPELALFGEHRAPLVAPLDEGQHAGALVVPVNRGSGGTETGVLHWDGALKEWTREPIEAPEVFRVLAIGASSPSDAWLLAQLSAGSSDVSLFRRTPGAGGKGGGSWQPVTVVPGGKPAGALTVPDPHPGQPGAPFAVPGAPNAVQSQTLTVTGSGVWIDGERTDAAGGVPVTMYFKPGGEGLSGELQASWCNFTGPPGEACTHPLPESLSNGHGRSIAWADPNTPGGFGQRVITGLGEGVSLRLEGETFTRVLALGASESSDVGGTYGAAYSNPREGWLGNQLLPVHVTGNPAANRLTSYPVPFRHALAAIAAQPHAPVGALTSQALAVGDVGEVARFIPGEGWQPESLLSAGGRAERPHLRAVAWPTSTRAYAVGQEGEMWLWRGETGLWERDPATPINFRGDLLGIAFDPANPSRGYAIGQQGVLLRYGKSWTQEALPTELAGASFTSIAFAGSQAVVAYRIPHTTGSSLGFNTVYSGGLLINDGSGWRIDANAATALGSHVPWTVAGLADGGAAVSTGGNGATDPFILERGAQGAPWLPPPVPYPGVEAPGSLALFREGGALRVVASGGIPNTLAIDSKAPAPAGLPPNLIEGYPLQLEEGTGYLMRQTQVGWSDEQHDHNPDVRDPFGEYKLFDSVYQPDPVGAVLIDPTGTQGWAVGGTIGRPGESRRDTADVERYPADGVAPPGFASAPVPTNSTMATFAIGGGAQCAAPCADRANAGVGPDTWLTTALAHATNISGVRAFLYTGPRLTTGQGHGSIPVPYGRELARYSSLLGASSLSAYAVATPTDLTGGEGGECSFEQVFARFPFAGGPCTAEPETAYYAFDSDGSGGRVRVVMLDDSSGEVTPAQLAWLASELREAQASGEPAIVAGNADLNAQIAANDKGAREVAETLLGEKGSPWASAYFYDSPEHNVSQSLSLEGRSIPTFGSGTLGHITAPESQSFTSHSGFLLGQVETAGRSPATNVAPVTVHLIPNIGELALEAQDGVLLHRSQAARFEALARRPRAGGLSARQSEQNLESSPYIPIPANCVGAACASAILPEYSFSSSRPDIGDFVEPNLASPDRRAVLLGPNEKPIHDSLSGLFCAYNAGSTVVTITAGGFSASLTVTVQAGSVRRPCGTQPLKELPAQQSAASPVPPPAPAPAPAPAGPAPAATPTPVPVPPAPAAPAAPPVPAPPAAVAAPPVPAPFLLPTALSPPVLAFVPLPVPTPARPTPPTGASSVTSPVEAAEREEEHEEAPESVSNKAVAYRSSEHEPSPAYLLGIVVLAAFAGAGVRRRPRGGRRAAQVAPATLTAMRTERANARRRRPW